MKPEQVAGQTEIRNMRATAKLYNISPSTVFYWKSSDKKPENHEVVESHSDATYEYKITELCSNGTMNKD